MSSSTVKNIQQNRSKVKHLGHIVSDDGLKLDHDKVKVIKKISDPNDKEWIQRLRDSQNFFQRFYIKCFQCHPIHKRA